MFAQVKTLSIVMGFSVLMMTFPAAAQSAVLGDEDVVATVNGEKILKKDVMDFIKKIPAEGQDPEKIFPLVLDQMINDKLLEAEIVKTAVESDPAFIQKLEETKSQMVKAFYLEKYLKEKVSDKAIKSEYEKVKKENKGKKEVRARHILVSTEEEAKQVIKDLDGGAKFEDLAAKRSSDATAASRGGDLGWFVKDEMVPEFSEAAFKIKKGTYGKDPVKSQFGWHVIYVEDKRDRKVPGLEEVENIIRNKLSQDAVEKLVGDLRAKADIQRMDTTPEPAKN